MKKQLRGVLIAAAVLVVFAVVYFVLLAVLGKGNEPTGNTSSEPPASDVSSTPSEEPTLHLYEYDVDTFVSAEITTLAGDVYHVERRDDAFTIPELAGFSCYLSNIRLCAERLCAYSYYEKVTDSATPEELEEYGFSSPRGKATVTFTDGKTLTVLVGGQTEEGLSYFKRQDDDTVVLTTTGITSYFLKGKVNFLKSELFSCAEERRKGIDKLEFIDAQSEYPVKISKTDGDRASALAISSTYYLTYPTTMGVDSEALDTGLTDLSHFSGEGVIEILDETTDLAVYGLDAPRYTLSFTYQKPLADDDTSETNPNPIESYKFYISDADELGTCYVYAEGGKTVSYFTKEGYSFMTWTLEKLAGSTFLSPMIKTLERMNVRTGGRDYTFYFTEGDGSISAVRYEDRQLDVDNFKKFYQVVLGTGWIDLGRKEEGAAPLLEISFVYRADYGKVPDTMIFYPFSLRQYAVEVNGEGAFTVPKTRVDKVIGDLNKVIRNEPVTAFLN